MSLWKNKNNLVSHGESSSKKRKGVIFVEFLINTNHNYNNDEKFTNKTMCPHVQGQAKTGLGVCG